MALEKYNLRLCSVNSVYERRRWRTPDSISATHAAHIRASAKNDDVGDNCCRRSTEWRVHFYLVPQVRRRVLGLLAVSDVANFLTAYVEKYI